MKGTPLNPQCGYSNFVVELLKKYGKVFLIQVLMSLSRLTFSKIRSFDNRLNCIANGRPILNFISLDNWLEAVIFYNKCIRISLLKNYYSKRELFDFHELFI